MKAEIQVIKLYREILEINHENDSKNIFFATDYFDALTVESKKVTDSFASIMNLKTGDLPDEAAGSSQSYTLYFSAGMGKNTRETQRTKEGRARLNTARAI